MVSFLKVVALWSLCTYPFWQPCVSLIVILLRTRSREALCHMWIGVNGRKALDGGTAALGGEAQAFIVIIVHVFYLLFQVSCSIVPYDAAAEVFRVVRA